MLVKSYSQKHVKLFLNTFFIITLLIYALASTCVSAAPLPAKTSTESSQETILVQEVLSLLESNYVESLHQEVLELKSIEEIMSALDDPHTSYMSAAAYDDFIDSIEQQFSGIGIYIEMVPRGVLVISVIEGSPAQKEELLSGDIIIWADSYDLAGLTQQEAVTILRGEEGSTIELLIDRQGEIIPKHVTRQTISIPLVQGELYNGNVGYIRVTSLGRGIRSLVSEKINELKEAGAKSWILDLRNNSGGWLDSSYILAGFFIGDQKTLITRNYNHGLIINYQDTAAEVKIDGSAILLTNQYSASGSEIVAAALKDYQAAMLIGTTSFGKGSMQNTFTISDEAGGGRLKMTTARLYSPLGNAFDGLGVEPHFFTTEDEDALDAGLLFLSGLGLHKKDPARLALDLAGQNLAVDLTQAREEANWPYLYRLLQALDIKSPWKYFYADYKLVSRLEKEGPRPDVNIFFSKAINIDSVTGESIELVEEKSGRRVLVDLRLNNEKEVVLTPLEDLGEKEYWLLVHQNLQDNQGRQLTNPAMALLSIN